MTRFTRLPAVIGLAGEQLRHDRLRTVLAVLGVALAVLAATLLASVGYGVVHTGQQKFNTAGRDLWVTGGPVRITPGAVGGFQSSLHNAHTVSAHIESDPRVSVASPMLFQTVYVGNGSNGVDTVVGTGVPDVGRHSASFSAGGGFTRGGRVHYANGTYAGPITHEVIVGPQIASRYDVGVGSTLHVGGTVASARRTNYTVVGVSGTFSRMLGSPTVTVPLSELQTMTGAARTDRATFVTVSLQNGADVTAVKQSIQREYPQYDVRTNKQELQAVLENQIVVIASGLTLVILAVIAGLALTVNVLALLVSQQRRSLAALRATGVSAGTLAGIVASQGVLLGLLGGLVGLALTPVCAAVLNRLAATIVGFHGLVRTPTWVFAAGLAIAVIVGGLSAAVAGWQVARVNPLDALSD